MESGSYFIDKIVRNINMKTDSKSDVWSESYHH